MRWLAAALVFAAAIALHPGLASTTQVEGQRPVATLSPEREHLPVPNQAYKILVNFTEDVNDFTTSDIAITGGEVASGTLERTGADRRAWRFTVYPYPEDQELLIRLPADAVTDDDGNGNALAEWRSAMGQVSDAILVSLDPATVGEGQAGTEITATVSLNHAPRDIVSYARLEFGDAGDGAVRNQDYRAPDRHVVTIPAGQKSVTTTFTVTPINDSTEENSETLTVRGIMPGMTPGSAILTILDDDDASTSVSLSLDPDSMREDAGSVSVEVTAALNAATRPGTTIVSVTVGASGDGASRNADFTAPTAVAVTIPAGQTTGTATFTLTPVDDELVEGPETITVHGTASGLTVNDATLTLDDNETASTSVSLSLNPASVSEDAGSVSVEVTATLDEAASPEPIAVNVTVGRSGDSAVSGTDYASVAGFVLTIPGGQTTGTATFSLAPEDDELAEGAKEITVQGTAGGLTVDDAALTLNDDDAASTSASLSLDPGSVSEDAGSVSVEVTAALDGAASSQPTTVNVTVGHNGDSAESGTDYTSVAGFAVTIAAGQTTGTATFSLAPEDDQVAEGAEEITVHGTASGLSVEDATLTLNDDDAASTSVSLSLDPASVSEDAGSVSVKVTAALDQQARPEPTAVTLTVGRTGDAAESGTDYTTVADYIRVVLTIPGGETTGTATFTLTPVDDELVEGPETITLGGTASGLTVNDATLTLDDNEVEGQRPVATLSPEREHLPVPNQAYNILVNFTEDVNDFTTSDIAIVGGEVASGTLGRTGADRRAWRFTVYPYPEDQELLIRLPADAVTDDDGNGNALAEWRSAMGQVSDAILVSLDPATVGEGQAGTEITATVSLNHAPRDIVSYARLEFGDAGDGAVRNQDYRAPDRHVVTIPAGQKSVTTTFTVTPINDSTEENSETLTVRGIMPGMTPGSAILTILDDDDASTSVSLSLDPDSMREDAGSVSVEVTAALNAATRPGTTIVSVTVGASGDGASRNADFTAPTAVAVTIPAGQTTGTATFTLTPVDDELVEGPETITVHGTASGLTVNDATLTLDDNETASTSVSLSLNPASVSEDAGSVSVEVTATLDEAASPEPIAVNVTVGRSGDSAVSGTDYASVASFVLTIPGGQTTATATFSLAPEDDELAEGAKEITVQGTAGGLTVDDAALTLNDDDAASTSVSLSLDPGSVSEDAGSVLVEVTAALDGAASSQPTTVNVTVGHNGDSAESGTDYTSVAGFAVTIAAGQTTGTATFSLAPEDDQVAEGAEEITVHGTASGLSVEDATLTLNDDDAASTSVSLSLDPASVSEDAGSVSVKVTAALDQQARPEPTAVTLTVGRTGDAAESGTDYTSIADYVRVVLTIPGGETTGTATFTLTPVDDELVEGPETITLGGTASGLTVNDATLTLDDNETASVSLSLNSASVSLSLNPASVSEDAGSVSVEVTATLDGEAGTEPTALNVTVGRSGDSAESGTDYTSVAGFAVTIAAGQTTGTATFSLAPDDDEVAEGAEEITVHGTASGLSVEDATLTLNDDDTASTSVSLSVSPASVSEDAGTVSLVVTATLDQAARPERTALILTVGRPGDTAESRTDYWSDADLSFADFLVLIIPAGQTTGTATLTLTPEDDELVEGPETFTLGGKGSGTASGLTVDDVTLTLNDDDTASTSVSLSLDTASVSEDDTAQQIEVTAELNQQAGTEPTAVNVTVGARRRHRRFRDGLHARRRLRPHHSGRTDDRDGDLQPGAGRRRTRGGVRRPSPCTGPRAASPRTTRRSPWTTTIPRPHRYPCRSIRPRCRRTLVRCPWK